MNIVLISAKNPEKLRMIHVSFVPSGYLKRVPA